MGLIESIQSGLARAIWKGVKHAGTAVAGISTALLLKKLNYELSADHQAAIALAVTGGLGTALKLVKDKFPKQFGWL